jgi:hypothetical protein
MDVVYENGMVHKIGSSAYWALHLGSVGRLHRGETTSM